MAKRVVQECDLTKQEYDPAETVTLVIKRSGKKQGRTYELSPAAASKLEQQLVSGNELPEDWSFKSSSVMRDAPSDANKNTIADLDDENLIAQKKQSLEAEGVELKTREKEEDQPVILPEMASVDDDCLHMNKTGIQTTIKDGERYFYRMCKACRKRLPEKTKNERVSFLNQKAPADSRVDYRE